jgi:hypothetical protein
MNLYGSSNHNTRPVNLGVLIPYRFNYQKIVNLVHLIILVTFQIMKLCEFIILGYFKPERFGLC